MTVQGIRKPRANNRALCIAFGSGWCRVVDNVLAGDPLAVTVCGMVLIEPQYHTRLPTCDTCKAAETSNASRLP